MNTTPTPIQNNAVKVIDISKAKLLPINTVADAVNKQFGSCETDPEFNNLTKDIVALTPEQFNAVRRYVSQLVISKKDRINKRAQVMMTEAEYNALELIAAQKKMSMSGVVRGYLKGVHPHLATLMVVTKNVLVKQQNQLAELITSERIDISKISAQLAKIEETNMYLQTILEERR